MDLEISNFDRGSLIPGISLPDLGWDVLYEANDLPADATPAWTKTSTGTPTESVDAGILHITAGADEDEYYTASPSIDQATGYTIETRLKVVSTSSSDWGIYFDASDNDKYTWIAIKTDGVHLKVEDSNVESYAFDTTDDFHTYGLTRSGNNAKLYVDNILRLEITTTETSAQGDWISFGSFSGESADEAHWDYFYYSTGGAFVP